VLCGFLGRKARSARGGEALGGPVDVPDARARLRVGRVCAGGRIGLGPAANRHVAAGADAALWPPITLEQAKRVMAAAELEAAKNSWQVAIAILDSGGNMVMFHKLDNTQLASIGVSEGKANTALRFKRPSKALDDAIATGGAGLRLLAALIARGICAETCSLSLTAIRRASSPVSSSAAARASRLLLEIDVGGRLALASMKAILGQDETRRRIGLPGACEHW
jgi:uncharacterized protein GlcG (DUF336 family)